MKNLVMKILCLEDVEHDAILIRELLISDGLKIEFDHVSNEDGFTEKLKTKRYDLVLSDYNLPGFNGIAALMLSRNICPDVPFICISGTIGEDLAVELLHLGASDYILKDRLFRLPAAIQRALEEYEVKKARILAENELKESREKYKNLVENINDVVYEIDSTGIITYMSPIITEITGFPDSYYTGKHLFSFINEEDIENTHKKFENIIFSGMINPFEFRISDNSGNIIWLRTSSKPMISDGKTIGIRGTAIDITEKKNIFDQLNIAKEKAEESSRLKSAFLANIGHEIRTPLNGIMGFAELLQDPNLKGDEEKMYLGILKESGDRMLNTINGIIEMSKLEADQESINTSSVEVNDFMEYFYSFFRPEAEKKGLSFTLFNEVKSKALNIETDKNKMGSVVSNLIKNAIKFTSEGSVEFGCKTDNNRLIFYVKDTGIGIPSNRISAIFHRFVQADLSISRPYEGVGLGLSIAKSYSELLGGIIDVESEEGAGSTFSFSLPLIFSEIKAVIPNLTESSPDLRVNGNLILIVEDDDINLLFLNEVLKKSGYDLIFAKTGEEAVKACRENMEIALVLMDIKLPVSSGYEATIQIKNMRPDLTIIAQTAYAQDLDREKVFASGCSDYLVKPYKKEDLLNKILQYLKK